MSIDITVSLKLVTCGCGAVYAIPNWVADYECPLCASRKRREVQQERDEAWERTYHLERRIRSLRGQLTRRKRHP